MSTEEKKKLLEESKKKLEEKIHEYFEKSEEVTIVEVSTLISLRQTITDEFKYLVECKNENHIAQLQGNKAQCAFSILRLLEAFDDEEFYKMLWRVLIIKDYETWLGGEACKQLKTSYETKEEADVMKELLFKSNGDLEAIKEQLKK